MKNAKDVGELARYGFWGVLTTVFNIVLYQILLYCMPYKVSNLIAILATKIFAYIVNKKFVFRSKCKNTTELLLEVTKYVFARGLTAVVDYFGLILAVEALKVDRILAKYIITAIVIVLNYVLGKWAVFREKSST